jgi:hypothetical protein
LEHKKLSEEKAEIIIKRDLKGIPIKTVHSLKNIGEEEYFRKRDEELIAEIKRKGKGKKKNA